MKKENRSIRPKVDLIIEKKKKQPKSNRVSAHLKAYSRRFNRRTSYKNKMKSM